MKTSTNEDIYDFFNIKRDANKEEINNAFRRICRIYHPDMQPDPASKFQAEKMFNKASKLYKILIDDRQRKLYDAAATEPCKSLHMLTDIEVNETDPETGQLIATPNHFLENYYESWLEKAEQEKLTYNDISPQGAIVISVDACDLFRPAQMFADETASKMPQMKAMQIRQSVETLLDAKNRLVLGGNMSVEHGTGFCQTSFMWRRVLGVSGWSKTQLTVGHKPNLSFLVHGALTKTVYCTCKSVFKLDESGSIPAVGFNICKQLDKRFCGIISLGFIPPYSRSNGFSIASFTRPNSLTASLIYDDTLRQRVMAFVSMTNTKLNAGLSMAYHLKSEYDSVLEAGVNLHSSGVGAMLGYERKVSKTNSVGVSLDFEYPTGLALKFKWTKSGQQYAVNLVICDQVISSSAVVYSVILPFALYSAVSVIAKPYFRMRRIRFENEEQTWRDEFEIQRNNTQATTAVIRRPLAPTSDYMPKSARRTMSVLSDDSFVSALEDLVPPILDLDLSITRPLEPNAENLYLYQEGLTQVDALNVCCRVFRTEFLLCKSDDDFLAKLYGIRLAFELLLQDSHKRDWLTSTGRVLLTALLDRANKDPSKFQESYDRMISFASDENNWSIVEDDLRHRKLVEFTFYDVVLDFIFMDAFDDLANPPASVVAVAQNSFLSSRIVESTLSAVVWSVLKAKRSRLKNSSGFIAHFYDISEHVSPTMAWGFLGSDQKLKELCNYFKSQICNFLIDLFNCERVRFTCIEELSEDIWDICQTRAAATREMLLQ